MPEIYKSWIIAGFLIASSLSRTTVAQSPLNDFLARLASSGANVLVKSETDREGTISGFSRFNVNCGVQSKTINGTELRQIWNSDYVAMIEKTGEGKWSLQRLLAPNTEFYTRTQNGSKTASYLFGGPLLRRIESLDPKYTALESDDSVYEYQLAPDHPSYLKDPVLNSMAFRFDRNSKEPRLQEIHYFESVGGPGSEAIVEWVLTLEYPNDALFPMEIVAKGSFTSGSVSGVRDEDLWQRKLVEIDKDAKIDRSECRLTYYGLPEPKLARKDKTWVWLLLAALLTIGAAAAAWKLYRK